MRLDKGCRLDPRRLPLLFHPVYRPLPLKSPSRGRPLGQVLLGPGRTALPIPLSITPSLLPRPDRLLLYVILPLPFPRVFIDTNVPISPTLLCLSWINWLPTTTLLFNAHMDLVGLKKDPLNFPLWVP